MRYEIEWNGGPQHVTVRTFGTATLAGSLEYARDVITDPRLPPRPLILLDHRALDGAATTHDDIRAMVEFVVRHEPELAHGRCAIVVAMPLAYGLVRMWQLAAGERTTFRVELFDEIDAAAAWLAAGTSTPPE